MLTVRHAHDPLSGEGARITGGRFDRPGQPALYLSADPQTAYAEFSQALMDRPGLMCSFDVDVRPVVDLTDGAVLDALGIAHAELPGRWVGYRTRPASAWPTDW